MEIFDNGNTKVKAGGIPQGLLLEFGALFRFCSSFSIEKVWSLLIIWKTIRISKLTLVIAFALLLFPVLWRQRNWLWEVFKVLSIKFKLSTQHSSALWKSLPKCHSGANCGLLFTTTSEIFNNYYSKSLLL